MKMFCYGTLKRGYGNNRLLSDSEFLGEAISANAEFSMTGHGVPFLSIGGDQRVKGELWEVDDRALARIDRLEGHPDFYCRQLKVFVKENGQRVAAWVYLVKHHHGRKYDGQLLQWPNQEFALWRVGHGSAPNSGPMTGEEL